MTQLATTPKPMTLSDLQASGWTSRTVKSEMRDNLVAAIERGDDLFPGILGYEDTVVPEVVNGLLSGHDMLFLGEKGQAKSRLMRLMVRFLDEWTPYLDLPDCPVHENPFAPITAAGKAMLAQQDPASIPISWWHRDERYAERLAPGTKFADLISIGHGTSIGPHCLLVSLVGVAGSVTMGHHVVLGGQTGVAGHLTIGDGVQAIAQTGIATDIPAGIQVGGAPAIPADTAKRNAMAITNLAALFKRVKKL